MNIFFDTEFTNLTQDAQFITLAMVSECGKSFYAIFDDWNPEKCSDFVKKEVLTQLDFPHTLQPNITTLKGNQKEVATAVKNWLNQFESIQMWADVPHYDWVLFCELFGGALHIPKQIHYMCMDLSTLLFAKGYDINKNRTELLYQDNIPEHYSLHNALSDAQVGMLLLKKLLNA